MLFNDADTLSYKDILSSTGLEEKELKRTLQSLACGKVRRRSLAGCRAAMGTSVLWGGGGNVRRS
jgi:hypothetical protein